MNEQESAEEVIEEREYVVPIKKLMRGSKGYLRAKKAAKVLREFISRHMHTENVKLMEEVNRKIWERGIRNPPRRIKVRVIRTRDNVVKVYLIE
ncbi:50S ribosomal protein L31e [Candidatus Geothermarchaeota archaeon]|nr:MAG: 50S ribosomal protein L31e [Candidatus Geothermarchaeota archaeon]